MSKTLITQYYNRVDKLIQFGGTKKETSVRNEFYNLLNHYAEKRNLVLVAELPVRGTKGKDVTPDGTLKNLLRLEYGYWESKDESLDLDEEIDKKIKKGYPLTNILFEDSNNAILIQSGEEVMRIRMRNPDELDRILDAFVNFRSPLVKKYEEAIQQFQQDIPTILNTLRERIDQARESNQTFTSVSETFLELCKAEINPEITMSDVREMMIQHILTSDIFNKIFDDPDFHRHNNIANELEKLIETLFNYSERRNLLGSIEHYYDAINAAAASVADHHEKQKFLKALYESFYKAYNPKAADRLGVVYTPNEIVDFMVDSTNFLLEKHFNRLLWDKNVEILDPATGTGTFICSIIDKCPQQYLAYKYKNELHANDVAILPYYVANLNIEYTFKQKMGYYAEFPNICFVDTLDNTGGLAYEGKQHSLFGLSSENSERIKRQNEKKISVVIGNPPYNAKQGNYNYQNTNKAYKAIDKRIKESYIKNGTAQNQIVVYDMYTRFYRWASDRVDKNGMVCFITNNSFINGRAFDGFRKSILQEFDYAYIVDLGGNIRELSGKDGIWLNEEHTIFGVSAAVGIAIMWLIKKEHKNIKECQINYIHPCDIRATRIEKFDWIKNSTQFGDVLFEKITPDNKHNWINQADNDFEGLLPLIDKDVKAGKSEKAIFKLFSRGVATQRDEWVYDFSKQNLENKVKFMIDIYQKTLDNPKFADKFSIKWDRELSNYHNRGIEKKFETSQIINSQYRPFLKQYFYFDKHFNGMTYQWFEIFNTINSNCFIAFNSPGNTRPFFVFPSSSICDLHLTGDSQCLPLFIFDALGNKIENITDWGLEQFQKHYAPGLPSSNEEGLGVVKDTSKHNIVAQTSLPSYRPYETGKNKLHNNPALKENRKELRNNLTPAEAALWNLLKEKQLEGKKFRRQHSVGPYILDFYCPEEKLAIELDGEQHYTEEGLAYDEERTAFLNQADIKVLRFENNLVIDYPEEVLEKIKQEFGKRTTPGPSLVKEGSRKISKEDIFHYVYAVLHNPAYRKKYELNLKREFPRIPFYEDFWKWADWGKQLMDLHINYETVEPYPLAENTHTVKAEAKRQKEMFSVASEPEAMFTKQAKVKTKLKADKQAGIIEIDELTFLSGIPREAWDYKLGNRSALEWVLDQYKEKKPTDPTIAEKFNTYRFSDYKEHVIDLLKRVCTVSVETVKIVGEMGK